MNRIAIALICLSLASCATAQGAPGDIPPFTPGDMVCFTRAEIQEIRMFQAKCKADRKAHIDAYKLIAKEMELRCEHKQDKLRVKLSACYKAAKKVCTSKCNIPVGDILIYVGIGALFGVIGTIVVIEGFMKNGK